MTRFTPGRFGGLLALTVIGAGLLLIGLGYNGMASNHQDAAQLPYLLSGGVLGLALVVFGTGLMVTQSARQDRQRLEAVLLALLQSRQDEGEARSPMNVSELFVAGSTSYHRPGCRLVDGREEVSYLTAAEVQERSLKPCRVCHPQQVEVSVG